MRITWSPGATFVTPSPTSTTTPAPSCPGTAGIGCRSAPRTMDRSEWQTPVAASRTRTCPGPVGRARRRRRRAGSRCRGGRRPGSPGERTVCAAGGGGDGVHGQGRAGDLGAHRRGVGRVEDGVVPDRLDPGTRTARRSATGRWASRPCSPVAAGCSRHCCPRGDRRALQGRATDPAAVCAPGTTRCAAYHAWSHDDPTRIAYVSMLRDRLPAARCWSSGCGPGDPATRLLANGTASSASTVGRAARAARGHAPAATLVQADMTRLVVRPERRRGGVVLLRWAPAQRGARAVAHGHRVVAAAGRPARRRACR